MIYRNKIGHLRTVLQHEWIRFQHLYINRNFIRFIMSTSVIKQITIIHQYQTLPDQQKDQDSFKALPKLNSHRIKEIISVPKIHNSLKCNKQKQTPFIAQMSQLKVMPRRDSESHFSSQSKKKNQRYQKRLRFHTQTKNHPSPTLRAIEASDTKPKIKKIFLPNLKKFDDFDYETDRIRPNEVKTNLTSDGPSIEPRSHDQETNFPQPPAQSQQISPFKLNQQNSSAQRRQQPYLPLKNDRNKREKKIYKYIEKLNSNHTTRKPMKNEEDEIYTTFSPTYQKQYNIIFHNFKNKQLSQASKNSRNSSLLSKPAFDLSKIKQNLNQFLLSYVPLNPQFDAKQFIRNPKVQIVPSQNSIFVGQVIDGKMEGRGVLITEKQLFEGLFFRNAKKEGFQKNRNGIYQGLYELGKRSGNGKFIWNNGETYEGDWKFGKKNGHGIWKSPKGDYYQGEWKDNLQNGKGCYYHKGCSMYRGYFKNSLKQGRGEEEFENGQKYQGEYDSGKPHGYGKYTWANGDAYDGNFVKGSREGNGTLRKINGDFYEGQFKDDMKDGFGKEVYQKGEYFKGHFEKGLKVSGSYFTKDGKQIQSY